MHVGTAPYSQTDPLLGLDHLEEVMEKRPELKVVIPHLGFYEFDKALSLLARYPNIYLDTSWTLGAMQNDTSLSADLPVERLVEFMERYPHRFLYGSDFPIIEYQLESGLEILRGLGLTAQTLRRVVYDNARDLAAAHG
jgi:predicted TIM-barrel fold metal-dependent hydrolase